MRHHDRCTMLDGARAQAAAALLLEAAADAGGLGVIGLVVT